MFALSAAGVGRVAHSGVARAGCTGTGCAVKRAAPATTTTTMTAGALADRPSLWLRGMSRATAMRVRRQQRNHCTTGTAPAARVPVSDERSYLCRRHHVHATAVVPRTRAATVVVLRCFGSATASAPGRGGSGGSGRGGSGGGGGGRSGGGAAVANDDGENGRTIDVSAWHVGGVGRWHGNEVADPESVLRWSNDEVVRARSGSFSRASATLTTCIDRVVCVRACVR